MSNIFLPLHQQTIMVCFKSFGVSGDAGTPFLRFERR